MENELSDQFDDVMLKLYERMKLAGFRTPRFLRMVRELGGVEAAKRMVHKRNGTVRFRGLVEERQFKLTVEWLVTRPKWKPLFTADDLRIARSPERGEVAQILTTPPESPRSQSDYPSERRLPPTNCEISRPRTAAC